MTHPTHLWNDWQNAELYAAYVHEFPIYQVLNRRLAELAQLEDAHRVLDLACGSGATAQSCLRLLPGDAALLGIDTSEAMVGVAGSRVPDPRARFRALSAEQLDRLKGPFDRVVCNAAFWQLPERRGVLRNLARLVPTDGLFVFNLPADRLRGEATEAHPLQVALGRIVRDTGAPPRPAARQLDLEALKVRFADAGFEIQLKERFHYAGRQREMAELLEIPVMLASAAPELPPEDRLEALRRARRNIDEDQPIEIPWVFLVARRL